MAEVVAPKALFCEILERIVGLRVRVPDEGNKARVPTGGEKSSVEMRQESGKRWDFQRIGVSCGLPARLLSGLMAGRVEMESNTTAVHFMHCAKDTLSRIPEIDVVVRGEGELTLLELAKAINSGVDLETV